jgi:ribonuclease VapC
MILDSSTVIAIVLQETGYETLLHKLTAAEVRMMGAPTLVKCSIVLSARTGYDCRDLLARFLAETNVHIVSFGEDHYSAAVGAWFRFGKGRHRAALNFGDCFSYAVAKLSGLPLLFVENDFPETDILIA